MKKFFLILVLIAGYLGWTEYGGLPLPGVDSPPAGDAIAQAYAARRSNVQVQAEGRVTRVLSDDTEGSRHQRFIVRLDSGQTVLIAHNIDLAPRVAGLREQDRVAFYGEYEWNAKGGVVHWTHRDPARRHPAGWIEYQGRRYD